MRGKNMRKGRDKITDDKIMGTGKELDRKMGDRKMGKGQEKIIDDKIISLKSSSFCLPYFCLVPLFRSP
jgi:hypothetical protein